MSKFSIYLQSAVLVIGTGILGFPTLSHGETCLHVPEETTLREIRAANSSGSGPGVEQTLHPDMCNSVALNHPVELESSSKIPVILVPVSGRSEITVNAPSRKEVVKKIEEEQVSVLFSNIMGSVLDIQSEIRKHELDQALHHIVALEGQYPSIKILEFTRASILLLQGHRDEAKKIAEAAIQAVPDYQEGKRFLSALGSTTQAKEKQK